VHSGENIKDQNYPEEIPGKNVRCFNQNDSWCMEEYFATLQLSM
jgi:hypothetical protein